MKIFTLWSLGMSAADQALWNEAGFFVVQDMRPMFDETAPPDLVWLAGSTAGLVETSQEIAERLCTSYPKLFILHSQAASLMPPHWHSYTQQLVSIDGMDWIVGSKLEEPLPREVAEYLVQQKTAELAAVLYIVILESVFRETVEWCGHMSSVVGRM